jgi:hypothetical protein
VKSQVQVLQEQQKNMGRFYLDNSLPKFSNFRKNLLAVAFGTTSAALAVYAGGTGSRTAATEEWTWSRSSQQQKQLQ